MKLKATFENKFKQRQQSVESMPGFQAFRLLRPKQGKHLYRHDAMGFRSRLLKTGKTRINLNKAHQDSSDVKLPAYFLDRPFVNSYHMVEFEE
ncbi:antibiotic biosynthesis monooxygenase [Lentibacillus sp. CBA3610]|uniref:antibiotic biosynthesis monooxygenase family protein n=1 Tax=Lentibacillus sp. CBA3610 TaxID=2518176 RepID=UPI00350E5751